MTTISTQLPESRKAGARSGTTRLAAVDRYSLWLYGAQVSVDRYIPVRPLPGVPPIVFLHGWGMSHAGYREGLEAMALRGVRVDAFALPGYGDSSPLPLRGCGMGHHAEHLSAAIESAAFERRVHLTGHSFGGGIALKIAAGRPNLVERLTVVCPVGGAGGGCSPWPSLVWSFLVDGGGSGLSVFMRSFAPAVRRSAVTVAVSGWAARHANLVEDLHQAVAHGVEVHLILADGDAIVPAGPLGDGESGARISRVTGQHNWPHVDPSRWAELTLGA